PQPERNRGSRAAEARVASARAESDCGNLRLRRCVRPYACFVRKSMTCELSRNESQFVIRAPMRQTRPVDDETLLARLRALEIETPSWAYGNSGTRFHVYPWPGAARTVWERIDDAAHVHRLSGCCPRVALHSPWDGVDDWGALRGYAADRGIRIGAINPNLFGDDAYRLGSLCHPDDAVRLKALDHCRECVRIAREVGSTAISLWL